MKLKQFFRKLIRKLRGDPKISDRYLHRLMTRLENTRADELSCDEVFALVDEFAEASQRGEDVNSVKPLLRHHLDMCRECDEEYEALLQVLEGTVSEAPAESA